MKKISRRSFLVAAGIAGAAAALTACGGSSSSTSTAASTATSAAASSPASSAAAGSYTDYSAGFPERITMRIPVYERGFEGWDPTDNYYTKWVQEQFGEKYNVDVEYVSIARSGEVQDYMQLIASHTAPDIIFHYDMPQAVNYYGEGAIQDVDYDELAYYAPDFYSKMKDTIETYGKLDGHNAFIFAERDPIYYNYVTLIRKDWCDQVGKELPTSNEELTELLKAWKDAGLGYKNESLITKSFTYMYGWIDPNTSEEDLALYLDLNVAPFTWDATYRFLKDMNEKYNDGLIDPDFYLNTEDSLVKSKFVSGQAGTYGLYMASGTDVFTSLLANDPSAEVAAMPNCAADGYHPYYYQYPPYGMIMGINADTSDEVRAAVYMFLNWMIQPDNLFFLQHGIEGETYTLDSDGIATQISDYSGEAKLSNNNNKDMWCLVQEVMTYGDEAKDLVSNKVNLAPSGYEYIIEDSYNICKEKEQYGIISPIFTKTISSSSDYSADLNALWQEAYVACVTCKPEELDAKYEEYCQEYLDAGYQEILDEKQSLIDEGAVIYA